MQQMERLIKGIVENYSTIFKEHNKTIAEIKDFETRLMGKVCYYRNRSKSEFIKFIHNETNHFLVN